MTTFSPGDLVELRSGGPVMTIEDVITFDGVSYRCSWFAGDKHQRNTFVEAALLSSEAQDDGSATR